METLITITHVMLSVTLVVAVLFQHGKGAAVGATFGGSSQTMFGPRGPFAFLAKLITVVAAGFMITSMLLSIYSTSPESDDFSIIKEVEELEQQLDKDSPDSAKFELPADQQPAVEDGADNKVDDAELGPIELKDKNELPEEPATKEDSQK
ncbi:MAG: preprotein translocase subunit SecG [Nitrospinota bacterium]